MANLRKLKLQAANLSFRKSKSLTGKPGADQKCFAKSLKTIINFLKLRVACQFDAFRDCRKAFHPCYRKGRKLLEALSHAAESELGDPVPAAPRASVSPRDSSYQPSFMLLNAVLRGVFL